MKAFLKAGLLASVAWSLTAGLAAAQDTAPAEEASSVEDIVVTARKTEESQQTTPLSVSAFSAKALERLGAEDATALQGAVPNLNIVQGRGSSNALNIYIRGVGQPDALQTFDPAVGVYVDDVYYSRIRGAQFDLMDIERVEVLRGPQGTLYGKNTPGGALKFVTRKPGDEFRFMGAVTVGDYDERDVKASVSGPISDNVSVGLAAMQAQHSGYVTDPVRHTDYNDQNTQAVRAAISLRPSETFTLDISADYSRDDAHMNVGQATSTLRSAFGATLLTIPNPPPAYDFTATTTSTLPNSTKLQHRGVSAIATWRLSDELSLKSITAYRKLQTRDYVDIDATALQLGDVFVGVNQDQTSQEFQLNWEHGNWNVVGGLFWMKENISSHQEAYADAFTTPFTFLRTIDDDLETKSTAAYVNATYQFTDRLRGSVGVRWSKDEKDYDRTTSTFSNLGALNGTFAFTASDSWNDVSPMASLDFRVTDDMMIYGRVSKGYMAGGFNGRANNPGEDQPYDPETVVTWEAGVKSEWMDHRLRANLSIFTSDFKDFQARVSRSVTSPSQPIPSIDFAVLNAGKLKISGLELEIAATPIDGLLLEAQVGYLDASYEEFTEQRQVNPLPAPATIIDRSWQTPAFSPEWTGRYAGSYEFDLGGAGSLTVNAQARYRSRAALSVDNADVFTHVEFPGMWQDSYWLYDASLIWQDSARHYSLGLYGKNLGDEVYRTDGQEFSSVGGIRTVYYGAPQTWSLTFTTRW